MNKDEIKNKLEEIFVDIFDLDEISLDKNITQDEIDEWDSLSHINLIVEVEKSFKIKLTSTEITSISDSDSLIEAIYKKFGN